MNEPLLVSVVVTSRISPGVIDATDAAGAIAFSALVTEVAGAAPPGPGGMLRTLIVKR